MRHKLGYRKLNKATDQRLAILSSQAVSLIKYGKIKLTLTRAKEARKLVERLITKARVGGVASHRQIFSKLRDKEAVKLLFSMLDRFEGHPGGYTRITKIGFRKGDATPLALLELV